MGNAYNSLGQYQRAIEFLQQSLEIKQDIGDLAFSEIRKAAREGEGLVLSSLGYLYEQQEQPELANDETVTNARGRELIYLNKN